MGAFLEKPKTEKITASGEGCGIRYGVSAMQGWRMEMEDAHVCETNFKLKDHGFFGVFDGHAGPKVSQYCSKHLLRHILDCLDSGKDKEATEGNVKKAIYHGFLELDEDLKKQPQWATGEDRSGTTAIVVMVTPKKIIWGNCGDSRGLLCRDGKVVFSTQDHKPYNQSERARIEKAGGTVMMQRVNGSLAVSRALGDFDYKRVNELKATEQLVSPEPEITVQDREPSSDEFLLLACDGIFDVMSNEEVVAYVSHHLKLTDDLTKICSDLIDTCLNKNSRDNMSVVLVTFPGAPKVSQEAIEAEEKLQEEAMEVIGRKIKELGDAASDPLELDENYVVQKLTMELPMNYDIFGKRKFISDKLNTIVTEKFGNRAEDDFSGPSDASDAPSFFSFQGNNYIISAEGDGSPPVDQLSPPPTSEGESGATASSSENLPSDQRKDEPMEAQPPESPSTNTKT